MIAMRNMSLKKGMTKMNEEYDSSKDTLLHIMNVQRLMLDVAIILINRSTFHDGSKLESPEKELFNEYTPKLSAVTYGSDEYKQYVKKMGIALQHHYELNSHHPEHYEWGIHEMTLMDIMEMFCDWKAASLHHADGSFSKSLEINRDRFEVEDQLHNIFMNTAKALGWD